MGELGYPGGAWGGEYGQAWDPEYAHPPQDDQPLNPDWVEYPFEDLDIWNPLKWVQPTASDRQAIAAASPLLVGLAVGLAYTAFILVSPALNPVPAPRLQSDDLCGLTTGGQVITRLVLHQASLSTIYMRCSKKITKVKRDHLGEILKDPYFRTSASGTVRSFQIPA